jgi:hypothetical protein
MARGNVGSTWAAMALGILPNVTSSDVMATPAERPAPFRIDSGAGAYGINNKAKRNRRDTRGRALRHPHYYPGLEIDSRLACLRSRRSVNLPTKSAPVADERPVLDRQESESICDRHS